VGIERVILCFQFRILWGKIFCSVEYMHRMKRKIPMPPKCPSCNAILYSRMSGICPECRNRIPPELLPTEEEKLALKRDNEKMRNWVADEKEKRKKKSSGKN
jgi:hypothetical protein